MLLTQCIFHQQQGCHNVTKTDEDGVILYYVERSNPKAPHTCTRYAWSTVGYPTLFISQDNSSCECEYDLNKEEYTNSSKPGPPHSVNITGKNFSLAIVFMRLIEFTVDTKKANSYTVFNVTKYCDTSNIMSKVEFNSSELMWNLTTEKSTLAKDNKDYALTASMKADNDSHFNFKINVSCTPLLKWYLIAYYQCILTKAFDFLHDGPV